MFDLFLVVVGAILGFLLSILTTSINKIIDKSGKIYIFSKPFYQQYDKSPISITEDSYNKILIVPLYFEFQNTTSTPRVLRDVCLYLYMQGHQVCKMVQIQNISRTSQKNGEIIEKRIEFGSEKNSYSFVLPPSSIQRQKCEFAYKISKSVSNEFEFDEIRFAYYNEKNNLMECKFCDFPNGWNESAFDFKDEFCKLDCKRKREK